MAWIAPELEQGCIHVWTLELAPAAVVEPGLLSPDEIERALRYRHPSPRSRFIARRGALRRLLASYLGANAAGLRFGYGPQGKPHLPHHPELKFNVSHARDCVVIAIAVDREVGVDIAAMECHGWWEEVARVALSPMERRGLAAVPPAERTAAFFRIWTRKEAYLKAEGSGLARATETFSVSSIRGDADALLLDHSWPQACSRWRIAEAPAPAGFVAAVASSGRDWTAEFFG